jgi:hypothetical protein
MNILTTSIMNNEHNKERNLQEYFSIAKNQDMLFTNEKLRGIVENASLNKSYFNLYLSADTMRRLSLLSIILASATLGTVLWFNVFSDEKTVLQESSTTFTNSIPKDISSSGSATLSHTPAPDIHKAPITPSVIPASPEQHILVLNKQNPVSTTVSNSEYAQELNVESIIESTTNSTPESVMKPSVQATTETRLEQSERSTEKSLLQKQESADIEGITPVTLTAEEAAFLGISVKGCNIGFVTNKYTITFLHNYSNDKTTSKVDWGSGVVFDKHDRSQKASFNPWLVTTERGATKLTSLSDENIQQLSSSSQKHHGTRVANKFIPRSETSDVQDNATTLGQITVTDKQGKTQTMTINQYVGMNKFIGIRVESGCPNFSLTFWYEPTKELIQQLPSRYRTVLTDELATVNGQSSIKLVEQDKQLPKSEEPQTGCRYMDVCRTSSGAILESIVYPNPAREHIALRFTLTESRRCSISLYYMNGIFAQQISTQTTYAQGEHNVTAPLNNREPGMYLLSMITDKGERIVQRIVIEK